jgi:L-fucose isomerase-like protein
MDRKKKEPIEPDPEEVFKYLFPEVYDEILFPEVYEFLEKNLQYQEIYPIILLSDDSGDSND